MQPTACATDWPAAPPRPHPPAPLHPSWPWPRPRMPPCRRSTRGRKPWPAWRQQAVWPSTVRVPCWPTGATGAAASCMEGAWGFRGGLEATRGRAAPSQSTFLCMPCCLLSRLLRTRPPPLRRPPTPPAHRPGPRASWRGGAREPTRWPRVMSCLPPPRPRATPPPGATPSTATSPPSPAGVDRGERQGHTRRRAAAPRAPDLHRSDIAGVARAPSALGTTAA